MTTTRKNATIVVDLGFGDGGKGSVTDFLCRSRHAVHSVVRYNGGSNAAHNVVTVDGRHHRFSQFGSGTFVPGVRTFLSRHVVVSPLALIKEEAVMASGAGVRDAFARLAVSERCLTVTPFHFAANRLRETARDGARHGSCGIGFGEAVSHALERPDEAVRAADLRDRAALKPKLLRLQERVRAEAEAEGWDRFRAGPLSAELSVLEDVGFIDEYLEALGPFLKNVRVVPDEALDAVLKAPGGVVFEGAQGVLIDQDYGFYPYTTWSRCTFANALELLKEHGYDGEVARLGVVRAYAVRHGPGPFPSEDAALTEALPEAHNGLDDWQGAFRAGWFDAVLTRYALEACGGADTLAVTCLDRLKDVRSWKMCVGYVYDSHRVSHVSPPTRPEPWALEAIGDGISDVTPILETVSDSAAFGARGMDFLSRIERETGVPVRIESHGPTASDKRWR